MSVEVQEAFRILKTREGNIMNSLCHIVVKVKEQRIVKAVREKQQVTYKSRSTRLTDSQ